MSNYIVQLDASIDEMKQTGAPFNIYDLSIQIDALYGKSIDGIADAFETMTQHSGLVIRSSMTISAILKRYKISDEGGGSFVNDKFDDTFLNRASEVLGDTTRGLSAELRNMIPTIISYYTNF